MKTALSGLPVLSSLLERAALKFVDVGGRGSGLKNLLSLAPYAHYFVSEPDAAEAGRLGEELSADQPWRQVTVFNEAIASRRGDVTLHVTVEPGMSSLLEPDPDVTRRFFNWQKFTVEKTETVPAIPLDDAAEQYGFGDACFLKLDTQGTELDIMRSGPRLMAGPVLGVYLEANLHPFYKGQAVFADVDGYMRAQGFSLCAMNRTALRRTGFHRDIYSKRVVSWVHCLYLREPASLLQRGAEAAHRDLPRLLALALTFQFYDHLFEVVECCRTAGVLSVPDLDALHGEMERLGRHVTKRVFRDAAKKEAEDVRASLLSRTVRDKNHPASC